MTTIFLSTDLPDDLLAELRTRHEVIEVPEGATEDLASYGTPDGWLMDGGTPINAQTFEQLPSLRFVSNYGVGFDSVNIDDATAAGVVVANTPGVLDNAVAEHTLGLIIALGRGILRYDAYVRDGSWERAWAPLTNDIHGKTLGVVGMGRIGKRLAELVQPLGMRVLYHNRSRNQAIDDSGIAEYAEWEDMMNQSDFVSLHTPLTDRTRGFFVEEDFKMMKPSAYLINMARGAVVNQTDLVNAIKSGTIAGAALDVFVEEPLPASSELLTLENVIVQPHNGSATVETRRAMIELAVENLELGLRGEAPRTPINFDAAVSA